jgi:hypothetical protein
VELGFMVNTLNKVVTSDFKYRLFLPEALKNHDQEFDKLSVPRSKSEVISNMIDNKKGKTLPKK